LFCELKILVRCSIRSPIFYKWDHIRRDVFLNERTVGVSLADASTRSKQRIF